MRNPKKNPRLMSALNETTSLHTGTNPHAHRKKTAFGKSELYGRYRLSILPSCIIKSENRVLIN